MLTLQSRYGPLCFRVILYFTQLVSWRPPGHSSGISPTASTSRTLPLLSVYFLPTSMLVFFIDLFQFDQWPNQSPDPMRVGAGISASRLDVFGSLVFSWRVRARRRCSGIRFCRPHWFCTGFGLGFPCHDRHLALCGRRRIARYAEVSQYGSCYSFLFSVFILC